MRRCFGSCATTLARWIGRCSSLIYVRTGRLGQAGASLALKLSRLKERRQNGFSLGEFSLFQRRHHVVLRRRMPQNRLGGIFRPTAPRRLSASPRLTTLTFSESCVQGAFSRPGRAGLLCHLRNINPLCLYLLVDRRRWSKIVTKR